MVKALEDRSSPLIFGSNKELKSHALIVLSKTTSKRNLSAANSAVELERVKTLINKRNRLIGSRARAPLVGQPLKNRNRTNLPTIQRTRKKLRSAERRVLVKVREKKHKNASTRPTSTTTHPNSSEATCWPWVITFFEAVRQWSHPCAVLPVYKCAE